MRKIASYSILFILCIATSCMDENKFHLDSVYKKDILSYLDQRKSFKSESEAQKIDELIDALDFKTIVTYDIRSNEKVIIADIKSLDGFSNPDKIKALFYVNYNKIVRLRLVAFKDANSFNEYDKVILSILQMSEDHANYTGKISFYNSVQLLLLQNEFENGELKSNGLIRRDVNQPGVTERTNECTDWYLYTTYYYSDGSSETISEYLYTTCGGCNPNQECDDPNDPNGTGSGGGSSPTFPSDPSDGDVKEVSHPNGVYLVFRYNAQTSTWVPLYYTVPAAEITSNNYPFLAAIPWPINGQIVFGPDNMIFTYNAASSFWVGVACLQNQLTDPCLKGVADIVLNPNLVNTYNNLIQELFNSTEDVNWILKNQNNISGSAVTDPPTVSDMRINITTTLDPTDLSNKSQEFIASTIYHEAFHAIMFYYTGTDYTPTEQHYQMMTKYLNLISEALQGAYPNISLTEAKGLILKEALNTKLNPIVRGEILNRIGLSEQDVTNIVTKFITNAPGSTPCN